MTERFEFLVSHPTTMVLICALLPVLYMIHQIAVQATIVLELTVLWLSSWIDFFRNPRFLESNQPSNYGFCGMVHPYLDNTRLGGLDKRC